jgi:hypothetical protein
MADTSLPRDGISGARRFGAAVADQVDANHAMVGGKCRCDLVPPIDRRAEAVDQDNRRAVAFDLYISGNDAGVDDLAAIARRRGPRLRVDPARVGQERQDAQREYDDHYGQPLHDATSLDT